MVVSHGEDVIWQIIAPLLHLPSVSDTILLHIRIICIGFPAMEKTIFADTSATGAPAVSFSYYSSPYYKHLRVGFPAMEKTTVTGRIVGETTAGKC
jgi:hypothetical protein